MTGPKSNFDPAAQPASSDDLEITTGQEEFWEKAEQVFPGCSSERYSIRVDRDIYDWFLNQGPDWELRVNEILRGYMESNEI